jgi:hypothetical protein
MPRKISRTIITIKSLFNVVFEILDGFPEPIRYPDGLTGLLVNRNGYYVPGGNQAAGYLFVNRKLECEARVAYIAHTRVDMQCFIEEGTVFILAVRLHIKEIDPFVEKIVVCIPHGTEVFYESGVIIGKIVPKKNMSLHIGFHVADLNRRKEFKTFFQELSPFRAVGTRVNFPFFDLPNFLGSPHNSSITPSVMSEAIRLASENVAHFLTSEQVRGMVRSQDYLFSELPG